MTDAKNRPSFIRHVDDLVAERGCYPGEDELLSEGKALAKAVGLQRIGIHLERLPPGTRTSWPHAEETEEEFVMVTRGSPSVWVNGVLYPLSPGDIVGFPAGTGIAHTFINDTHSDCELLVVGENRADNRICYPLNPGGHPKLQSELVWKDAPVRLEGEHDGLPHAERERRQRK